MKTNIKPYKSEWDSMKLRFSNDSGNHPSSSEGPKIDLRKRVKKKRKNQPFPLLNDMESPIQEEPQFSKRGNKNGKILDSKDDDVNPIHSENKDADIKMKPYKKRESAKETSEERKVGDNSGDYGTDINSTRQKEGLHQRRQYVRYEQRKPPVSQREEESEWQDGPPYVQTKQYYRYIPASRAERPGFNEGTVVVIIIVTLCVIGVGGFLAYVKNSESDREKMELFWKHFNEL